MMPPLPIDILRYYRGCLEGLDSLNRLVMPSIEVRALPPENRFFGMTVDEFRAAIDELRSELEQQVVLMLTASFEAVFQMDRTERFERRKKGDLSKALRKWWKAQGRRPEQWLQMESLLEAWKKTIGHRRLIGQLKSLFLYRHWLAHGRYWTDKSGLGRVDPFVAWQIGKAVFDVLPGFPPLPSETR